MKIFGIILIIIFFLVFRFFVSRKNVPRFPWQIIVFLLSFFRSLNNIFEHLFPKTNFFIFGIFIAAFFGPVPGIITGVVTNLVNAVISGPTEIPFLLVNGAIGLIVGLIAKYRKDYNIIIALIVGLILSIVAPLIGTPIAIFLFGGLTGSGMDFVILWLKSTGQNLFSAVFIGKITANLLDKFVSSLIVFLLLHFLPLSILKDSILEKLVARRKSKVK